MNLRDMINRVSVSSSSDSTANSRYDDILDRLGLQRKRPANTVMSTAGLFGMGMAVGAALGVLFAPKRGRDLRSQAVEKIPGKRGDLPGQEQIYTETTRRQGRG